MGMKRRTTKVQIAEYGRATRLPKKPMYEFGDLQKSRYGVPIVSYYESDFGQTQLRGESIIRALGAHRRLKRPKRSGRECYRNCGPCAAEAPLNAFLQVVFVAGGMVSVISEEP